MAKKDEVEIKLTVDTSELDKADDVASDFPSEITLDVNANVDTSDLSMLEDLDGQTIEPTVDVQETDTGKQILDGINFLVLKEKFELVMNIVGTAWDFITKAENFLVAPFLDVENAVARINAQTGTAIPDLDQMIRDLQAADLGDSVDQIANVVIAAQQIGAPMREAATATLTFTKVFENENPETVLSTLNTLVETGLVPNLKEAADVMTVFFQQGGNVGGDALAVVNSNAQAWADMDLSISEALSTVDSLQQGTGATATEAAKMVQTFDDAMTAAAADPASAQAQTLKLMGIDNPKDQGLAIGNETIDGFAAAFTNLPADKQDLVSGMFFGKGGKKFTSAIEGMTTQNSLFADVIGQAEAAATEIDDSLRGAINDFVLEINTSIDRLLSSDEIDLPGKIADLKEGFQKAAQTLAEGGSLGDALAVGFRIEGVDTALMNIERIFGNLVISLLEVVAFIQDPLGTNDNDKGTRAEITRLATQQLPFDIKVANPEELDEIVAQAAQRGVTNLGGALNTALEELVASGDFDKVRSILSEIVSDPTVSPEAGQILVDRYTALIDEAIAAQKPPPETEGWWNRLKPPADLDLLEKGAESGGSKGGGWWTTLAPPPETVTAIDTTSEAATTAMTAVDTAAEESGGGVTTWAESTTGAVETVADSATLNLGTAETAMVSLRDQAQQMDIDINAALMGNTVTTSFEAVALSAEKNFPIVIEWFGQAAESVREFDAAAAGLSGIAADLAALQAAIVAVDLGQLQAIQAAANGGGGGGGGGGDTNNTNQTVTQNNVITNNAQAANSAYQLAAMLN